MRADLSRRSIVWRGPLLSARVSSMRREVVADGDQTFSSDRIFWLRRLQPTALDLRQMVDVGTSYDGRAFRFDDACYDTWIDGIIARARRTAGVA